MIRIVLFLILIFLVGFGFSWLAERPGDLVVTFANTRYQLSLLVAAVVFVTLIAAVMITWWLLKSLWNSPRSVGRYFRARKRDRGYQSLSTGMIAAGAGDGVQALAMARQASKLLNADQEPLLHMLEAQAALVHGDHDAARRIFKTMLDDPEARALGLRGLYMEAQREGDHDAARHYARTASDLAPQLPWAANACLEELTLEGDWDGALSQLNRQKASGQADKKQHDRQRAVLLTARAMALREQDPIAARNAAQEASRLAPDLIPATVVLADALFSLNDLRKGARLLETAWKRHPHPELADAYIHARTGDSAADRLKRAKRLASIKQNHPESQMAVGRAAMEAGEYVLARTTMQTLLRSNQSENAYLLMADIEERETGNQGHIRQWLSKAVRAPRNAAWTADGIVSEHWAPVSPVSGRLDSFEWRIPVERLGPLLQDQELDIAESSLVPVPPGPMNVLRSEGAKAGKSEEKGEVTKSASEKHEEPVEEAGINPGVTVEVDGVRAVEGIPADQAETPDVKLLSEFAEEGQTETGGPEPVARNSSVPEKDTKDDSATTDDALESRVKPASVNEIHDASEPETVHSNSDSESVVPRQPDDPGIDDEENERSVVPRFRLF